MSDGKVISFQARRRTKAAGKVKERQRRRNSRMSDHGPGGSVEAALYWTFLLWHKLSADGVDKELRMDLALALMEALERDIGGDPAYSVVLTREVMRYEYSDLFLLAKARDAYSTVAEEEDPARECHKTPQPDMMNPDALLESGILTEEDVQKALEANREDRRKKGIRVDP